MSNDWVEAEERMAQELGGEMSNEQPEALSDIFEYRDGHLYWLADQGKRKVKGFKVGRINDKGSLVTRLRGNSVLVSRIIFEMFHGHKPKKVKHVDGNPLNNHIENLMECVK